MKVQEIAEELKVSVSEFIDFLRQHGYRQAKPGLKLDPGATAKLKRLFKNKAQAQNENKQEEYPEKNISIKEDSIKVSDISKLFGIALPNIMKAFLKKGLLVNVNSEIDQNTLIEIGKDFNITVTPEDLSIENELGLKTKIMEIEQEALQDAETTIRPPVITIMGHVDHGKTALLDSIRKSNIVDGESGGITQHIGAYQIEHNGNKLTFLDTPGHEAFTSLRARGAQITDIAILVVSATEGIKPQTIEAISHAQTADVPIIVAINKMDLPDADPEKVKQQLSQYNLLSEDWGGKTIMVPVSAKTKNGIEDLLEMIHLTAELEELKTNANTLCKAVVIESKLSAQRGPIATIIVKAGTLKVGDFFVVEGSYGKVRAIFNDTNQQVKALYPGDPGEILGFSSVPQPGSVVESKATEKECKQYVDTHQLEAQDAKKLSQKMSVSLEALSSQAEEGNLRQLNLIIKADVHGSLEAIKSSIEKIESKDIPIKIIHFATGGINENDILLAKASDGIVFGFNSEATNEAQKIADAEGVTVKTYSIIYEILDDIKRVIQGLYKPEFEEIELGTIEVRDIFKFSKIGSIAGCYVKSGKVDRNSKIKLIRNKEEIFDGELESLKRFKDDVKEVLEGFECGIVLKNMSDVKVDDLLIAYKIEEVKVI